MYIDQESVELEFLFFFFFQVCGSGAIFPVFYDSEKGQNEVKIQVFSPLSEKGFIVCPWNKVYRHIRGTFSSM